MAAQALDAIDELILDAASSRTAARSASEIGRLVSLSPAAAKRRIDRLEQLGIIRGYTRDPRPPRCSASSIEAFTELRFAPGTQVDEIDSAVRRPAGARRGVHHSPATPTRLSALRVPDVDHLKRVIDPVRRGRRGGAKIIGTKTLIVLGSRTGPSGNQS